MTMVRGQVVYRDGQLQGEHNGRMVRPKVAERPLVTV